MPWLLWLAYASMQNCRVDWHISSVRVADVLVEVAGWSVNMTNRDGSAIILELNTD